MGEPENAVVVRSLIALQGRLLELRGRLQALDPADVVLKDVDMADRFQQWNEVVRIARAADEIGMFGGSSEASKLRSYRSVA